MTHAPTWRVTTLRALAGLAGCFFIRTLPRNFDAASNAGHLINIGLAAIVAGMRRTGSQALTLKVAGVLAFMGAAAIAVLTNPGIWGTIGGVAAVVGGLSLVAAAAPELRSTLIRYPLVLVWGPGFEPGASRSRTVSVPCPRVSRRLRRGPLVLDCCLLRVLPGPPRSSWFRDSVPRLCPGKGPERLREWPN